MRTTIEPYLFIDGCCEEAIEFYREHLGSEVEMMMRYSECPDPLPPEMLTPGSEDKIMHATLRIGESVVMASDSCCGGEEEDIHFAGFSQSLALPDETEAKRIFDLLSKDGKVEMPLGETFWSPCYGMLTDRFGLGWMITTQPENDK